MLAAQQEGMVPIVEVAFRDGKWWSIPQETSAELYDKYVNGQDAGYTWDCGNSIDRYVIDFSAGVQTNTDNQRKHSIRLTWVRPQDGVPQFTGER